MGDDYYSCFVCPHCDGYQITLPVEKDGHPRGATDCMDCGTPLSVAVSPYHEISAYSTGGYKSMHGPIKRFKKLEPVLHNIEPKKKRRFPTRDERELGEMLVAVNLLLDEYPETGNYMPTLKKHLEEDVATLQAEASA